MEEDSLKKVLDSYVLYWVLTVVDIILCVLLRTVFNQCNASVHKYSFRDDALLVFAMNVFIHCLKVQFIKL